MVCFKSNSNALCLPLSQKKTRRHILPWDCAQGNSVLHHVLQPLRPCLKPCPSPSPQAEHIFQHRLIMRVSLNCRGKLDGFAFVSWVEFRSFAKPSTGCPFISQVSAVISLLHARDPNDSSLICSYFRKFNDLFAGVTSKMNKMSIFEEYGNGNKGQNWNNFKSQPHPHLIILPFGSLPFSKVW